MLPRLICRSCYSVLNCKVKQRLSKCIVSRMLCDKKNNSDGTEELEKKDDERLISGAVSSKYRIFRDEESPIILDLNEERQKIRSNVENYDYEEVDEFAGISLTRGVTGVFEVEELVDILRKENAMNIFVVKVPPEFKYVNHIVIITGKSPKHMYATAEFIRRVFKKKRLPNDLIPRIEGEDSKDWIAMDLGNIVLHIFSKKARAYYDLESLWSVGADYDNLCNKPDDPSVELLLQHSLPSSERLQ